MKKAFLSVLSFIIIVSMLVSFSHGRRYFAAGADESEIVWAQIKRDAELYEKKGDEYSPICVLPETYFVALLESAEEILYKEYVAVSYLDVSGYMKKSDVEPTDFEPVTKYAEVSFTAANEGLSAIMRSTPNHDGDNALALIPDGEKLTLYGPITGTSRYENASKVWYYVKYTGGNKPVFGYIYSYHGIADPIPENKVEKVEKPAPPNSGSDGSDAEPEPEPDAPKLYGVYETVFIICLCIPAVLIMFMLFRSPADAKGKKKPRNYAE